jgi:hypothetical protein
MRKWLVRSLSAFLAIFLALGLASWILARHFEPFVRDQAIRYLEDRFGTGVELPDFHVAISLGSPMAFRTATLTASGRGLVLPYREPTGCPPLIRVGKFQLKSEIAALWYAPRHIREIDLQDLEINIPPGQVHKAATGLSSVPELAAVLVDTISADRASLRIFTADPAKPPLVFDIHHLALRHTGPGHALAYRAVLSNPRPVGLIDAAGEFGPWQRDDPGLTQLSGEYLFRDADLGVFGGIAGTLRSAGRFQGMLRRIAVHGQTWTPNFRLPGGTPVPLTTRFDSIVDGTSGDTLLQPVQATLGRSVLVAHGGVIHRTDHTRRSVILDVVMSKGSLEDLLRLALKNPEPFMRGEIGLRTKLEILPQPNTDEKLLLDGAFNVKDSQFNAGAVQEKIDTLSRRAQGQPRNEEIADVLSDIRAGFTLRDGEIRFSSLTFHAPGAYIHLKGMYNLYSERIDLRGIARLQAKVSQTMTGWKRWVLKPVDPFFSKAGAGTLLPIKVSGTREKPEFGLDRGPKEQTGFTDRQGRPPLN